MEFFEEIEDLKYNYQQSPKKTKDYASALDDWGTIKFVFSPEKSENKI